MSNFDFLQGRFVPLASEARRAEGYAVGDPRTSSFYARRALELAVEWMYEYDTALRQPYQRDLNARLHEPTFARLVPPVVIAKMQIIRRRGNDAVHRAGAFGETQSVPVVRELFHVLFWLATHYAPSADARPEAGRVFDLTRIPRPQPGAAAKSRAELQALTEQVAAADAALTAARADNATLAAELEAARAEIAAAKQTAAALVDTHDYDEAATRDTFIDLLLAEAGWPLDQARDREFEVSGMPNNSPGGVGFVDYVLWGADGLPLAVVEAKRTRKDPHAGQQQAELYADALERQFGQRPLIYYTNGYEHWLWDDTFYPPRAVQGFATRDELALAVQRRTSRVPLASIPINEVVVERPYQHRAIRRVGEVFEQQQRRALLVMATGSGKTRTVIALADQLMRAGWVKRVLFLADRVALVNQATAAFKEHLPASSPVNLVTEKGVDGRVMISTYPTMMGLINEVDGGVRRFGPNHFDLIVIDEAHRSVYQKYGAIFQYFDAHIVGLTATPKDEVDHNTYSLFGLEDGVPTDSYDLTDAIADGYLVPPVGKAVATSFVRQGIRYDDLSEDEKEQWDLLEWADGEVPDEVDAAAVNQWLFNADTVDKVLQALMTEGRRVNGGDLLGKTIVFAKSQRHAQFIVERFDANYPHYAGHFARIITHQVNYAQSLIDDFSTPAKFPQIAVSVDMLDTGIDVPDVVNLVFFKEVHSKTKYWQMVGRGTRLRPDLYGPGDDKKDFVILDVCQNIEYFNQQLPPDRSTRTASLTERLVTARVELVRTIDQSSGAGAHADPELAGLRELLVARLQGRVAGMSLDNVLVRPQRRQVERFAAGETWLSLGEADYEVATALGSLPSAADASDTDEAAKRFDLLALRGQLAVLATDALALTAVGNAVRGIADALAHQKAIPAIASQLEFIDRVASVDWWVDVTVPMLEQMRVRLRDLVRLLDPRERPLVYTDFEDTLGPVTDIDLVPGSPGVDRERFRAKALAFLRARADDAVLFKVRHGKQLTALDLESLEAIMRESGEFTPSELEFAANDSDGLGLFVRSLLGLDRSAAQDALADFIAGQTFTANQLAFLDLLVSQLTMRGIVEPGLLFEDPFTGLAPTGPQALFTEAQVADLIVVLKRVRKTAEVA
ncbi:DEAD/DEAH box helicase family protein [Microcella sp.]|uniref:DEAD/DEAH box helicase family protein n=1 Tax=Microcella sp. TaxID=1913979 RepID=UPI003918D8D3